MTIGPGLRYWLPETEFTVTATRRKTVAVDEDGSRLAEAVDVDVAHAAAPDRSNRRLLEIEAGLLEKIDLKITLDDRGFVTAVNSEAGRDIAPVLSLVGKAISLAATVAVAWIREPPKTPTLESRWAEKQPGLAAALAALNSQVDRLLRDLGDPTRDPLALRQIARALDAVQSQAATIVAVRRAWIDAMAGVGETATARLRPLDLVLVKELEEVLPEDLPGQAPRPHAWLVKRFGCLLAIVDPDRRDTPRESKGRTADKDKLIIRQSRPATIGVYLKQEDEWRLQPDSVLDLDIVDRLSEDDVVPLDGSWLRTRAFEFGYHPDMSLKTYGVKTTSSAGAVSLALGGTLDAAAEAMKALKGRPSEAAQADARRKVELDRLKTETEFETLSAARARAPAVAVAEQIAKLKG